jgi:DNA topoisomerase-1
MAVAQLKRVGADIDVNNYQFRATGQTILFDGYLRVYMEGKDESEESDRKDEDQNSGEKFLPELKEGDELECDEISPVQHFTKPPPRYTEASLVKKLEEEGIGRPSTYAPTISTIQQRGYIKKEGKQLIPEEVAFTVTDLLAEHFADIVNLKFTAKMEQSLDDIADGKEKRVEFIKGFFGPFEKLIASKKVEVKKEDIMKERILGKDPKSGLEILVRTGRFGPYIQIGRPEDYKKGEKPKSASVPSKLKKDAITLEEALDQLSFPKELGKKGGEVVTVNLGRYGPYVRWGKVTGTLPVDMEPGSVDLKMALEIISTAKEKKKKMSEPLKILGNDPNTKDEIQVKDGRYGPYVTDGTTNASIPKTMDPYKVTIMDAAEWLEKKRHAPKRKGGWKKR